MASFGFLILFGICFLLYPCKGRITSPADGTKLIFMSGSTVNITWMFHDVRDVDLRTWYFKGWSKPEERLASISGDGIVSIPRSSLSEIDVVKPATLILKNVNQHYNGEYRFVLTASGGGVSVVSVVIAEKPNVTFSCSSRIIVNEGDNLTCICKGVGGNPPANVTWHKGGSQLSETGTGNQTLNLRNIDRKDGGKYNCVAQSHTLIDKKSMKIIVYYNAPPVMVSLRATPEIAVLGQPFVITCEAVAVPLPRYTIIHNDTQVVSMQKTYNIKALKNIHVGSYRCIATNELGNSSTILTLSLVRKTVLQELEGEKSEWYIFVVILLTGIITGIFLSFIVFFCRRKFISENRRSAIPEQQTNEVDTTYQELDLSKMNTEDNYQSLKGNFASNDKAT